MESNGAASLLEMRERIARYRKQADDPRMGSCILRGFGGCATPSRAIVARLRARVRHRRKRMACRRSRTAIGLLSPKDLAAFVVENAQCDRSRRPRDIRGGDDCCRHVLHLNLDFRQSRRSAIWRRADKLDSERVCRGGKVMRHFACQREFRAGSRLARRGHFAIPTPVSVSTQCPARRTVA